MKNVMIIALFFSLLSCQTSNKTTEKSKTLPGQMQLMAEDVRKLLPFLYDQEAFRDPKNREQIHRSLKEFAQAADHIKPSMAKPFLEDELLVEYSLTNLKEDLNRAAATFNMGQFDYSRSVAKASMSHCFRCHSVTQTGSSAGWDLSSIQKLNLAPLERADLLVATRKYDQALSFMEQLLNSIEFQKSYAFDFEALLRRYLALIIRVEKAPDRALAELNKILDRGETPHYIAVQAEGWQKSLRAWKNERPVSIKSANELFRQVERRFARASALQNYDKDHAGDVEYLRATSLLHQNIGLAKEPKDKARAMYLLGKAYEVLDELGSWNLHESYYEACILKDPKSVTSKSCYSRLEASLFMGYSGSSGTHLPMDQRARLKRLKDRIQ